LSNTCKANNHGYVFIDILVGLLIFSLGFVAVLSLNNWVAQSKAQADNYLEAVNIASSTMDEILHEYKEFAGDLSNMPNMTDRYGKYERVIVMTKDAPNLCTVSVKLKWIERGEPREYLLESLLYVNE